MRGRRQYESGFSALYLVIGLVVLGLLIAIGVVVSGAQSPTSTLVPIEGPVVPTAPPSAPRTADSLPDGFVAYTNAAVGFTFAYPSTWGGLQPVSEPSAVLKLSTAAISGLSLADALQVRADKKASAQIPIGDKGVTIRPVDNGATFDWVVVNRGTDKVAVGKSYTQSPTVVYRSGKAVVYAMSGSRDNCTFTTWLFASQDNIIQLRLPSFCISDKVADADVQAGHKAQFDTVTKNMLQSITVL